MADFIQFDGKAYIPMQAAVATTQLSQTAIMAAAKEGKVWLRAIGPKVYVERDSLERLKGTMPTRAQAFAIQVPPSPPPMQKVTAPAFTATPVVPLSVAPVVPAASSVPVAPAAPVVLQPIVPVMPIVTAVPQQEMPKPAPAPLAPEPLKPEVSATVAKIQNGPTLAVELPTPTSVAKPVASAPIPKAAQRPSLEEAIAASGIAPVHIEKKELAPTVAPAIHVMPGVGRAVPSAGVPVSPQKPPTPAAPSPIAVPVPSPVQPTVSPIQPTLSPVSPMQVGPKPLMQRADRPLLSSALALLFTVSTLGGGAYAFTHTEKVKGMVAAVGDAFSTLSSAVSYDANAPQPTSANLTYGPITSATSTGITNSSFGLATSSRTSTVLPVQSGKPATYVYNYPVIERIVPQSGFITEGELSDKLNQLSNRLVSLMYVNTSAQGSLPASGGYTNNIALTQRIDKLGRVDISDSTYDAGTITNTSIGATTLNVSGASALATTTLGNTTINGNASSNFLDIKDGSGTTVFAVQPDGTLISSIASTTQSLSQLLVTGNATATNMVILNTASTTNLLATNATTTNIHFTNATGVNATLTGQLSTINASTSLLSVFSHAYFGGTATSTFDATGFLTLPSGFNSQASSTIGGGTQGTGLTINGGATTTGSFSVGGSLSLGSALSIANGGTGLTTIGASSTALLSNGTSAVWQQLRFAPLTSGTNILLGDGSGGFNSYAGTSCTNQFVRSVNGAGVATCASVSLTADVTGTLPQGNGGTGQNTYAAGDILFADGAGFLQKLPIGTSGNVLTVQAGLPAWGTTTGGGSGVVGGWATTTNNQVLYPSTTAWIVNVGANATSTLNSIFEVHGQSYFSSLVGIGTTSPATTLSVGGNGYITGGLGVGVLNTVAGTIQSSGTATVGNLINNGVTANTLIYVNGSKQESSVTVSSATGISFSGGTLSLSAIPNASLANSTISGIALGSNLASLTATNGSLTFSGAYNGGTAQTVGLNLANANNWTGLQTFTNASSSIFSAYNAYFGSTATSTFSATGALSLVANGLTVGTSQLVASGNNIGIGTTTPYRKLSVKDTVSAAQAVIAYDDTRYTELQTNSAGDYLIAPSGGNVRLNNQNLFVCSGGACPTGAPSGNGNLIVGTKLGVGTSTPAGVLSVFSTDNAATAGTAQLFLEGNSNNVGVQLMNYQSGGRRWELGSSGGSAATPSAFTINDVTAAATRFNIDASGNVGIGTTTPSAQLAASGLLFIGANGATGMGTATSTFYGDIKINGKLDVSTIDPVYTIDGTKFATYGASTVGIHEETVLKVTPTQYDAKRGLYDYAIDFAQAEKGSDVWLFYQVTDFGSDWQNLVVSLTPGFDGRAFYEQDVAHHTLHILTDKEGPVSVRLIANRYDFSKWQNLRPDQDGKTEGTHVISSK